MDNALEIRDLQNRIEALEAQIQEQNAFLSKVIHNLKNLLTRVISCDQYILSQYGDQFSDTARQFMIEADECSFQMNDLFVAINTIVHVRSQPPLHNALNLAQILQSVRNQLRDIMVSSGAHIEYPAEWPAVFGDALYVEKVWYIFLNNAITYSLESPRIIITATLSPNEKQVQFTIADNGSGLTDQQKALMYKPFPRIQVNTPNSGGVGLYMARIMVEHMGGTVGVESTPGQGSAFSFTLPTV